MRTKILTSNFARYNTAVNIILVLLAGLSLPILLIPLARLMSSSIIIEELLKALVVFFIILKLEKKRDRIIYSLFFGFLFGASESFLYLTNIFQLGTLNIFWQRFLWTIPMHIITVLVILFSGLIKKWFLIFGLIGAIILHILFNGIVMEFLTLHPLPIS